MDARGHLAQAEQMAVQATDTDWDTSGVVDISLATLALAHATIALAIEVGAPHSAGSAGGGSGG